MASYELIPINTTGWTVIPAALEAVYLQPHGGAIYLTDHHAPADRNGLILQPGQVFSVDAGQIVRASLAASSPAVIARVKAPTTPGGGGSGGSGAPTLSATGAASLTPASPIGGAPLAYTGFSFSGGTAPYSRTIGAVINGVVQTDVVGQAGASFDMPADVAVSGMITDTITDSSSPPQQLSLFTAISIAEPTVSTVVLGPQMATGPQLSIAGSPRVLVYSPGDWSGDGLTVTTAITMNGEDITAAALAGGYQVPQDGAAFTVTELASDSSGVTAAPANTSISPGSALGSGTTTGTRFTPSSGPAWPQDARLFAGELTTSAGLIVDHEGRPVRIRGINWHGFESVDGVPLGLFSAPVGEMLNHFQFSLGINAIRFPVPMNMLARTGAVSAGIDQNANPWAIGLSRLQILDWMIDECGRRGIYVLIDGHRKAPGVGVDLDGVWYGAGFTEDQFVTAWQGIATRYADHPAVIGADLWNEPHKDAHWGDPAKPTANDWRRVAGRVGSAVQAIAPKWLIFVEGVQTAIDGTIHWLGGQLKDAVAGADPVLAIPNKLVYAPHEYQPSIIHPRWNKYEAFNSEAQFSAAFNQSWLGPRSRGIPVVLGETGANFFDDLDKVHTRALVSASIEYGIGLFYWAGVYPSNDTGSILDANYRPQAGLPTQFRNWMIRQFPRTEITTSNRANPDWPIYRLRLDWAQPVRDVNVFFKVAPAAGTIPANAVHVLDPVIRLARFETVAYVYVQVDPAYSAPGGTVALVVRYPNDNLDGTYQFPIWPSVALAVEDIVASPPAVGTISLSKSASQTLTRALAGDFPGGSDFAFVGTPPQGMVIADATLHMGESCARESAFQIGASGAPTREYALSVAGAPLAAIAPDVTVASPAALATALDAVIAEGIPRTILLSAGDHGDLTLTNRIVPVGTKIVGEMADDYDWRTRVGLINISGTHNLSIERIDAFHLNTATVINVANTKDVTLRGLRIHGTAYDPLTMTTTNYVNPNYGVSGAASDNLLVEDCLFEWLQNGTNLTALVSPANLIGLEIRFFHQDGHKAYGGVSPNVRFNYIHSPVPHARLSASPAHNDGIQIQLDAETVNPSRDLMVAGNVFRLTEYAHGDYMQAILRTGSGATTTAVRDAVIGGNLMAVDHSWAIGLRKAINTRVVFNTCVSSILPLVPTVEANTFASTITIGNDAATMADPQIAANNLADALTISTGTTAENNTILGKSGATLSYATVFPARPASSRLLGLAQFVAAYAPAAAYAGQGAHAVLSVGRARRHAEWSVNLAALGPDAPAVVPIVPAGQTIKIAQLAQSHATVGKKPSTTLVRPALPTGQKIEFAWSDYTTQAARYWDSDTGDSTAVPPTYLGYAITARMLHDYPMQIAILDREGSTPAGLLDYEPTASGDWTPTYWENRIAAKDAAGMTPDILSIDWYPGGTHAPFYANAANPAGTDVAEMWRAFATGLNPVTSAAISVGQPTTFYGSKSWIFDHAFWADLPGVQHVLLPPVQDVDQRRALAAGDDFWPQQLRQQMREPYLCEGNTTINGHPDPHSEFGALLMGSIYAIIHAQRLGVPGSHPSRIQYTVYGNGAVVTSVDGPMETAAHKRGWTGDEYAAASTHLDRFSQNALIEVGGWWWDLGGATGYDVAYTALLRPRATRIVGNGIVVEAPQGVTLTSTARLRWIPSRDHPATIPGRDIGAPAMIQPEGRDVVDVVPIWGTGASPIVPAEIPASWAAIVSPLPSIRPGLLHVGDRADLSLGGSLNAVSVSNQLTLDGAAVVIANDAVGDFFSPTAPGELRLTTTVSNAIGGEAKDATALVLAVGARYGRGIELDGNNRYAMATTRAGEARGLVSLFFRATSWNTPSQQRIFSAGGLEIRQTSSARLAFRFNHASSLVTEILTTGWTSNIWHHVLLSWDHEANRLQIWRNGVSIYSAGFTYTEALTMVGTAANARVAGAASPSDAKLIGSIGHVLYEPGAEYDLADAYVRSLLIDPDGYPMWWGADASQLLGRPALVYCDGASAATWGNKGDVTMAPGTWSTAPTAMAATQPVAGNS